MKTFKSYLLEYSLKNTQDDFDPGAYTADQILKAYSKPFEYKTEKHKYTFKNFGHAMSSYVGADHVRKYLTFVDENATDSHDQIDREHSDFEKALREHHDSIIDNLSKTDPIVNKTIKKINDSGINFKSNNFKGSKEDASKFMIKKLEAKYMKNPETYDETLMHFSRKARENHESHPLSHIFSGVADPEYAAIKTKI